MSAPAHEARARRALAALVALLALAAVVLAPSPALARANRLVTITIPDRHGTIGSKWLGYPGPPRANVLLPGDYDPGRRYPLLVLLNGLNTNYSWYATWGLTKAFDGRDVIVVMPEGASGWYTDWWNGGRRGSPEWETYELDDVLPAILRRYPIRRGRRYHAIAGTSMGGLGATYLGGRLPGFFGSVASLSGFVDPQYFAQVTAPAMGLTSLAPFKGVHDLHPVAGPPRGFYFDGHNPARLAANLQHTRVFATTGTGAPGKGGLDVGGSAAEGLIIYPMNELYDRALNAAGVEVTYSTHPGGHDIPNFAGEIEAMLTWGLFEPVAGRPRSWVNDTVATHGRLWRFAYRFDRPPDRVVRFRRSGRRLAVSAAGSPVRIRTPWGCVVHVATPTRVRLRSCRRKT